MISSRRELGMVYPGVSHELLRILLCYICCIGMLNRLRIRIDGCVDVEGIGFEEILAPSMIDLPDGDECSVFAPIQVHGNLYKANDWVILEAAVTTAIQVPCSTCNEPFEYLIHIDSWKVQENDSNIKEGFWDLTEQLREIIVLEFPFIAMCGKDVCKNFDAIRPYLKVSSEQDRAHVMHRPFEKLLQGFEGI